MTNRYCTSIRFSVINPIGPGTPAFKAVRIIPNDIDHRLQDTKLERIVILRHKHDVAAAIVPDLVNELYQARTVREIHNGVRFESVSISARYDRKVALRPKPDDFLIFLPGP